ncbi:hypothetical protein LCGC14_3047740, partial [marine sediment metagenome]
EKAIRSFKGDSGKSWIEDKKVKEFIRLRNRLDMMLRNHEITWEEFIDKRNKLAGKELI